MNSFFTYVAIVLAWIFSFVEPSGWALALHLSDKLDIFILAMSLVLLLTNPKRRQRIPDLLVVLIIIAFIFIPYFTASSFQGAQYLTSFLVVYIFSQAKVTPAVIKYTGISIAAAGLIILNIYINGELLSGWNDNAIAMVGLFSFIYFGVFLILRTKTNAFKWWNIITALYIISLFGTECRSGMIFVVFTIMAIIWNKKAAKILHKSKYDFLILNIPLIVALIVIWLGESSYFAELDKWSKDTMESGKGIFNERNELWDYSLKLLSRTDYIGTGKFILNYHNSAMACLSVFGIFGYYCWIRYFYVIFKQYQPYLQDKIVIACLIGFTMIFLQQSLDLGFISPYPNRIPYMILGLGLGRIYYIKRQLQQCRS